MNQQLNYTSEVSICQEKLFDKNRQKLRKTKSCKRYKIQNCQKFSKLQTIILVKIPTKSANKAAHKTNLVFFIPMLEV